MDKPGSYNKVIVDASRLKRIKVTCRCGNSIVEEIPGEVVDSHMNVMIECPTCQQGYVLHGSKLVRLDRFNHPEKLISAEGTCTSALTEAQAADEIEKTMQELSKKGVVIRPGSSRSIN